MSKLKKAEQALLFLTLLFLPTQLGKHFWPEFAFVYSLPIDYLSPTVYFWDLLVALLWIVSLAQKKHTNRVALNLFFLFILTQTFSLLSNFANIGVGLIRLEQYFVAGLFGVYIASAKISWVKSVIFWALVLSVLGETLLAVAQFIKGSTLGFWILGERSFSLSTPGIAKFNFYGREFLRPYATFPHPNVLAGFLIVVLLLLSNLRQHQMLLRRLAVFTGGLVVLLTVSRSAIITAIFSAFVLLKNQGRIILFAIILILLPILYTRFTSVFNFDNFTLTRREELSAVALTLALKSPILGIGLNNFIPSASDLLLSGPSRFLQPVHNIFLLALSETGIIGLIGLIGLIGYPLFKLFKLKPILLIFGAVIFLGLFDHYFLTLPQGYRLLFFIWGLSIGMLE